MPLHHVLMMINYDAVFFSQGLVDQLYFKQMMRTRNSLSTTVLAPACIVIFLFLYAVSSPMNYTQTGFLFFYPLYTDYTIQCLYTTGTWVWVYVITWSMHAFSNKEFNKTTYKLVTGSSMYAYVSHYFFIIMIAVLIIRPYKMTFLPALFLNIFLTNALIILSYLFFVFVYELIVPPKKEKEAATPGDEAEREGLLKGEEVNVGDKQRS